MKKGLRLLPAHNPPGSVWSVGDIDLMKKGLRPHIVFVVTLCDHFVGDIDLMKKGLRLPDFWKIKNLRLLLETLT